MKQLSLTFGNPDHGWLSVEIGVPGITLSEDVSDVPNDALFQLVTSLLMLAKGSRHEKVEWSLEPGYWRWAFDVMGEVIWFSIVGPNEKETVITHPTRAFLQIMCRALLKLGSKNDWSQDTVWSWDFPHLKLEELKGLVLVA